MKVRVSAERQQRGQRPDGAAVWTLSPGSIWAILFIGCPLVLVAVVSFMRRGTYGGVVYQPNLENYLDLFDPLYAAIMGHSLYIAGFTTLVCLLLGYPFAYVIANSPRRYRNTLFMLIIIPFWSCSLVRTYSWMVLLRTEGVINHVLLSLGVIQEPLAMLYNIGAIVVGATYTLFPFMVLPLYVSICKLDKSLLEAARDLGARPWQVFCRITLPLTMPGVIAGSLLVFLPALGLFFIPDLMGGSRIMIISNFIQNQFVFARNWPLGAAASVILIIFTLAIVALYLGLLRYRKNYEVL